jgi:uncharacterized protein (TIGR02001 family)
MRLPEKLSFYIQVTIGLLTFSAPNSSHADIHGIITGTTNYVYRGYSKSDDDPAVQANVDYQHESGIYLGASVSNVNFGDHKSEDAAKVEFTPYLGYTYKLTDDWRADIQWTRYLFDGKIFGQQSDYNEFYLFLHYRDILTLRASISNDFYGYDVVTGDYEITAKYPLTDYLEVSSGVGYCQAKKVLKWDFLYWNAGITGRYKHIAADLRYVQSVWTTPELETDWRYDPDFLHATVVFSLSMGF